MKAINTATLAGLIFLGAACSPSTSQSQTAPETQAPSSPTASPVVPPAPIEEEAVPVPELLTHSIRSSTGVMLEVARVTHEAGCLRLGVSLSGIYPPDGAPSDYTLPAPIVDAAIFQGVSELVLEPRAGGGGGKTPEGSFGIAQETINESGAPLPPGAQLPVIVELTMDSVYGFASPLQFAVQADPDQRPQCGLQGSMGP